MRCGMPQANSATSRPRVTSPSASESTLPCSAVMSAATSSLRSLSSSRKAKSTPARLASEASAHSSHAEAADVTTSSTSEAEARSSTPDCSPVAGLKTGDVRSAVPVHGWPAMRWVMRVGVLMAVSFEFRSRRRGRVPGGRLEEGTSGFDSDAGGSGRDERGRRRPLVEVGADRVAHVGARLTRAVLPGEDAGGDDAVEADALEGGEELGEVDLALPDVEVLVHGDLGAGRVDDVAQPGGGGVVVGVGDVDHRHEIACLVEDPVAVVALVEGVRCAVEEADVGAVDAADDVHGPLAVLLPVVGVRLEHEPDALLLEHGQQLVHRAPELSLADRGLARVAVELGVHRVDPE